MNNNCNADMSGLYLYRFSGPLVVPSDNNPVTEPASAPSSPVHEPFGGTIDTSESEPDAKKEEVG